MQSVKTHPLKPSGRSIHLFRSVGLEAAGRRGMAGILAVAIVGLTSGAAFAQQAPPPPDDEYSQAAPDSGPPPEPYQALGPQQLGDLVAPIALYPDSLVAQILAAATYPQQVVAAEQFVQQSGNYPPSELAQMANEQPWDPSVKSLVAFPQVLQDLNQNMNWTTDLGNAYYNQPQDVMSAVQAMRQRAWAAGSLRSTPQLAVAYDPGDIVISPVSSNIVYVPYYNPWAVYGAPLPVYANYAWGPPRGVVFAGGLALGFGVGFAIGAFGHFGWGYHNWAPNWGARTVVYNHTTYLSHSTTVINHGYYGRFDRNPHAVAYNRGHAARFDNRTVNSGEAFHQGGQSYSRGGQTFNQGYNHGGQTLNQGSYNRSGQTSGFNRQAPGQGSTFHGGAYNTRSGVQGSQQVSRGAYNTRTQQNYRQPQQYTKQAPARQQSRPHTESHSAEHSNGGGHDHR